MPDTSGHDATRRDDLHTITLKELEARILQAGIVMSRRQIMRHCKAGTFDAQKLPAVNNVEEWFIAPASVEKGIADIKTLQALRSRRDASRRDMSDGYDAEKVPELNTDTSGHDATRRDVSQEEVSQKGSETEPVVPRYVEQLEKRIGEKDDTIKFLQEELVDRRAQISGMKAIIDGQRELLETINNNVAPVFGALAQLVRGKSEPTDTVRATVMDEAEREVDGDAPAP